MALKSVQITLVTGTATPLLVQGSGSTQFTTIKANIQDPLPVLITNMDASITIFIGGPSVTALTGTPLLAGQSLPMSLYGETEIPYVIATGTPIVAVLVGRQ